MIVARDSKSVSPGAQPRAFSKALRHPVILSEAKNPNLARETLRSALGGTERF